MAEERAPCAECGGALEGPRRVEVQDYSGLPGVVVVAKGYRCPACGEDQVGYERLEDLHREIVRGLVEKPGRLAAAEVRYLRGWLQLEGQELAAVMGTAAGTVSRWENGATPIGKVADRLLRALVLLAPGGWPVMRFRELATGSVRPLRLRLELDGGHWRQRSPKLAAVS
jgi:putative zinc finger/helix-turn-helix YgiT family protein